MIVFQVVDLAAFGVFDKLEQIVQLHDNLLLLVPSHVVAQYFGNDLGVQHLLELGDGSLVLGGEIGDEGVELLLVDRFDVVLGDLRVRCLDFLVLEVLEVFLEVGDVAGRGQEHKDVLVDVLEAAVDVVGELADELRPHVVLHPEESQELPQVIDVVERPLLLQLLGHVLLSSHGPRLVRA